MPMQRNARADNTEQPQLLSEAPDLAVRDPHRPICLYDRIYFSPIRNLGTHKQLLTVAGGLYILSYVMLGFADYFSMRQYHSLDRATYIIISLLCLYMLYRYFLPYRRTGMVLIGDGRAIWSIHMAPHLGYLPWFYARTKNGFMERGAAAIVQAAAAARPGAIILLESHRLGDEKWRGQGMSELAAVCPSPLRMWEGQSKKSLTKADAWLLDKLKGFRKRHLRKEHGKPIRAGDPKGIIVVRTPTPIK